MGLISSIRARLGGAERPALTGEVVSPRAPAASYFRGGQSVTLNGWRPALRQTQDDIGAAWDQAAARTADAMHNSGWLAGAIEQSIVNVVGTGLRLKPMPETELIGMTKRQAREWVKLVERRWELWSNNALECDVEGVRTFGQMQREAYGSYLATGEVLSESVWRKRPWNMNGTKFRLLSPTRLSRRTAPIDRLINGVYHDADGLRIAYAVRSSNSPFEIRDNRRTYGLWDRKVRARDPYGRPRVIHVFAGPPETCRGITPLAPVLQALKQFDQLSDATLMASIVQSLFAATVTGEQPTEELLEGLLTPQEQAAMNKQGISPVDAYLDMVGGFYDGTEFDANLNGRVVSLFPGQKMEFLAPENINSNFPEFSKILLREICRCLGLTYESGTGDYHGATYASLGRADAAIHEVTKARRDNIVAPASQPHYEAWLEEEIQTGRIPFPGGLDNFLTNRAAACRALWRGAAKPIAEEGKLAKAHEIWYRLGVISEQGMAADLGRDYEDVLAERAEAMELRKDYKVAEPVLGGVGGAPGSGSGSADPDDDEDDDEANRGGSE